MAGSEHSMMQRPCLPGGGGAPHSIRCLQVLSGHIFCHVPCPHFNYRQKAVYIAICLRRMMAAIIDPSMIDDRCAFLYNFFSCR